jgi:outer membrane protein assembly factor BamB
VSYGRASIFSWAEGVNSNNLVLFSTDAGYFYALDADTGEEVWVFGPEDRDIAGNSDCNRCAANFRTPLLLDDVVYLPSHDHHVYALDATTGRELWRFGAGGTFLDTPSVANNVVYAANMDGYVYLLDANTGQQQSRIFTGRPVYAAFPDGDVVYAVIEGGGLRAFNVVSGEQVWQYGSGTGDIGGFSGYMALHNDNLIVMGTYRVYAINKHTGKLVWDFDDMRGVFFGSLRW